MKKLISSLTIRLSFVWYDLWVGFYYDTAHGILYFCPIPTIVIEFQVVTGLKEFDHAVKNSSSHSIQE